MTSYREGWGLVVTEAAAKGTPAVVYDVPGLRDAVQDSVTGTVVEPQPAALANATSALLENWYPFASGAREAASRLSWDLTAQTFAGYLNEFLPQRSYGG